MCSPAIVPVVTAAATVLSVGAQAYSAFTEPAAQRAQAARAQQIHARDTGAQQFKARLAENNAVTARRLADREVAAGRREEGLLRRRAAVETGRRTAMMGASGVALDSGSPLDVLSDMAGETESKALAVRADADMARWRRNREADAATAEGRLLAYDAAATPPPLAQTASVGGSLLTRAPRMLNDVASLLR